MSRNLASEKPSASDREMPVEPALSVIIVRFAGGNAIADVLAALESQRAVCSLQVIVVHRANEAPSTELLRRFPGILWMAAREGADPAQLRAIGVGRSTAPIVACTEDHCIPADDWVLRLLAAHAKGATVAGGVIDKVRPAGANAWVAYLLDYSRYMPPLAPGPAEYLSDCNVSYRRTALESVADVWREAFHETTVHWALQKRGHSLQLDPGIVVRQHREIDLAPYMSERREHGFTYACTRSRGAGAVARWRWAASTYLLPAVIVMRTARRLRQRGLLTSVPRGAWLPLTRAAWAWAAGERRGYVRGAG